MRALQFAAIAATVTYQTVYKTNFTLCASTESGNSKCTRKAARSTSAQMQARPRALVNHHD